MGIAVWLAGFFIGQVWLAGWWPEQKVESVQEMRERVVAKLRKVIIGELVQLRKLRKVQERGRERERGFWTAWVAHAPQVPHPLPLTCTFTFTTYHLPLLP